MNNHVRNLSEEEKIKISLNFKNSINFIKKTPQTKHLDNPRKYNDSDKKIINSYVHIPKSKSCEFDIKNVKDFTQKSNHDKKILITENVIMSDNKSKISIKYFKKKLSSNISTEDSRNIDKSMILEKKKSELKIIDINKFNFKGLVNKTISNKKFDFIKIRKNTIYEISQKSGSSIKLENFNFKKIENIKFNRFSKKNIFDSVNLTNNDEIVLNTDNFNHEKSYEKFNELTDNNEKFLNINKINNLPVSNYFQLHNSNYIIEETLEKKYDINKSNSIKKSKKHLEHLKERISNDFNKKVLISFKSKDIDGKDSSLRNKTPIKDIGSDSFYMKNDILTPLTKTKSINDLIKSDNMIIIDKSSKTGEISNFQNIIKNNLSLFNDTFKGKNNKDKIELNKIINSMNIFGSKIGSEDECNFSNDDMPHIIGVPVFNSKKLENCNKVNSKDNSIISQLFFKLLKFNQIAKNSIISYLTINDLINLSKTTKFLRKAFNGYLHKKIISFIINENIIIRMKIWKSLYKYSKIDIKDLRSTYKYYLVQKSIYEEQIIKDLNRTLTEDPTFKKGKVNYKKLFNILIAYSNYNKNIGYAQGLNFIVANSIIILSEEEEVFIFIDSLINKFNFTSLIGIDNGVNVRLEEIGILLYKYTPKLVNHLDNYSLNHEFFTANWLITIFSNSIKSQNLFKVWDFFFIYGWKFINYFIVSILVLFQEDIIKFNSNSLSVNMKMLLKSDIFDQSFNHIINYTFELLNI